MKGRHWAVGSGQCRGEMPLLPSKKERAGMKIEVNQADLARVLGAVSGVVDAEAAVMVVIGNLLLDARADGTITVRGTDMRTTMTAVLPGSVSAPGVVTLPADVGVRVAELMPAGEMVRLEMERFGVMKLRALDVEFELQTLPADGFPDVVAEVPQVWMEMPGRVFREMVDETIYAVAEKDHRQVLNGLHVEVDGNELRMTATDGKLLSGIRRVPSAVDVTGGVKGARAILDRQGAKVMRDAAPKGDEAVRFGLAMDGDGYARAVVMVAGGVTMQSTAIAGQYPDCHVVIPKAFGHVVELRREDLVRSIDRALVTAERAKKGSKDGNTLRLTFRSGRCQVTASRADVGRFSGGIPVEFKTGAPEPGGALELGFNGRFLQATLGHVKSSVVRLKVKNSNAPVLFEDEVSEEGRILLLMPVKLGSLKAAIVSEDEVGRAE